jgi:HCOMODA/2-hydroxy-3-carboxy-muconic semialdehyde decarboxylase
MKHPGIPTLLLALLLLAAPAWAQNGPSAPPQTPPASAGPADPKLIEDLVAANRILAQQGVLDGWGHISVRHDKDPNRFLLSRALAPELVTADDIMEYDLDSNPVDQRGRNMYSERFIHGQIYKARPDVMAVVHTHAPPLIPFGVVNVPLKPVYHRAAFLAGGVPIFDIHDQFGMTDMLIRNNDEGAALANTLGKHDAALMRGHGAVVVGPSLPMVVSRSIFICLDANAQAEALQLAHGGTIKYLDPEEARLINAREGYGLQRAWEAWKKKAMNQ